MKQTEIDEVLRLHALWLRDNPAGVRADLRWANLSGANLSGAIIRDGLTLWRYIGCASRGDGYTFYAFDSSAGEQFIFAGCRAFLRSEYDTHIAAEYEGTDKAAATRACLDYLGNLKPFLQERVI